MGFEIDRDEALGKSRRRRCPREREPTRAIQLAVDAVGLDIDAGVAAMLDDREWTADVRRDFDANDLAKAGANQARTMRGSRNASKTRSGRELKLRRTHTVGGAGSTWAPAALSDSLNPTVELGMQEGGATPVPASWTDTGMNQRVLPASGCARTSQSMGEKARVAAGFSGGEGVVLRVRNVLARTPVDRPRTHAHFPQNPMSDRLTEDVTKLQGRFTSLKAEVGKVIVGQDDMVERLLIGLLAGGHVLLEGVPGLAKTLRGPDARRRARLRVLSASSSRPTCCPADVVGTQIYNPRDGHVLASRRGRSSRNIVLADEINRAPAKVQSALLEAMQERQVTIGEHDATRSPSRSSCSRRRTRSSRRARIRCPRRSSTASC